MSKLPGYQFYYGIAHGCLGCLTGISAGNGDWLLAGALFGIAAVVYASLMSRINGRPENSERVGSDY